MKTIKPILSLDMEIEARPSKAHTLRALFLAALAKGRSIIWNPLLAEDQLQAIQALKKLGVRIQVKNKEIIVDGVGGKFIAQDEVLFIGNSGVCARFLTVLASLADKNIILSGTERMETGRPIQDLLDALKPLGIKADSINGDGCLPILVQCTGIQGGTTTLKGDKSSQYFSAILLGAPFAENEIKIVTQGKLVSKPYLNITIDLMKQFGVEVINRDFKEFIIAPGQEFHGKDLTIEGDFSSAAFFFAAAAITGGRVKVTGLNPESAQGDKVFVDFLEQMGCQVNKGKDWIEVVGKPLTGIKVDMGDFPDIVTPLAVVAAFAKGKSEFFNIAHLKFKECNRLEAPVKELQKMGIDAKCTEDRIIVQGGKPRGAVIETNGDHRMVMSFAIAGLKVPGIKIKNPENVNKSFPEFFEVLEEVINGN